ncbi:hypothetical protein IFO69_19640 [Echinicola sp. CAU 1574]|uniref:Uncharacterized protein n=1 Tax=Echinicola arenosa TaxID=2774144 RepID=A0ABR9AQK0_9BACT|nr:hypothetical protein [Echinicola arenosa]MBD8490975.1 hypothetical protein [Echinicola arenosa]
MTSHGKGYGGSLGSCNNQEPWMSFMPSGVNSSRRAMFSSHSNGEKLCLVTYAGLAIDHFSNISVFLKEVDYQRQKGIIFFSERI